MERMIGFLERGVPKGALVGPVLFSLFINYLLWFLKQNVISIFV